MMTRALYALVVQSATPRSPTAHAAGQTHRCDVSMIGGPPCPQGGGSRPLSEWLAWTLVAVVAISLSVMALRASCIK
eukprot:6170682-Prymnesium_polylepis.1